MFDKETAETNRQVHSQPRSQGLSPPRWGAGERDPGNEVGSLNTMLDQDVGSFSQNLTTPAIGYSSRVLIC